MKKAILFLSYFPLLLSTTLLFLKWPSSLLDSFVFILALLISSIFSGYIFIADPAARKKFYFLWGASIILTLPITLFFIFIAMFDDRAHNDISFNIFCLSLSIFLFFIAVSPCFCLPRARASLASE